MIIGLKNREKYLHINIKSISLILMLYIYIFYINNNLYGTLFAPIFLNLVIFVICFNINETKISKLFFWLKKSI